RSWRPSRLLAEVQGGASDPGSPGQRPQGGSPPSEQGGAGDPGSPEQRPQGWVLEHDLRGNRLEPSSSRWGPGTSVKPAARIGTQGEDLVLSFSAISAYRECPRQHWYRYRLRLPAWPGVEAQFGTILHLVLMRAGRLRSQGRAVTAELLRDLHQEAWEMIGLSEPRRRPALEALGRRLLDGFVAAGGLAAQPRMVEAPFAAAQDGWTLRGVIDRVDAPKEAAGAWRIVDYKSGSPVPASRLRRDLQLALYAVGARQALHLDPVELEIVYLKDGQRVVVTATDELLAEARKIGAEVADGIRSG